MLAHEALPAATAVGKLASVVLGYKSVKVGRKEASICRDPGGVPFGAALPETTLVAGDKAAERRETIVVCAEVEAGALSYGCK